jgi:hypothetical protein
MCSILEGEIVDFVKDAIEKHKNDRLCIQLCLRGSEVRVRVAHRSYSPDYTGFDTKDFMFSSSPTKETLDSSLGEKVRKVASSNRSVLFMLWNDDNDYWEKVFSFIDGE